MRHFVIDTDTASDDSVALIMALQAPDVQVEAITVVAGNVPLDMAVQNALYTVELCGKKTPVYAGMAVPMMRGLETAQNVHGTDGLGDIGLPLKGRIPAEGHGVDKLIETINQFAGNITLVTLGPLTNLALALLRDPSIVGKVSEYYMMGGIGYGYGNVTAVAEFNIWVDPEASKIVFDSGLPITMIGWDVSRLYATFDLAETERFRAIGTPLAKFCVDIQKAVGEYVKDATKLVGFDLPDPIAMAVALDRSVATDVKHLNVVVETGGEYCRGQTIVDHLGITGKAANTDVVLAADRAKFLEILYRSVR